MLVYAVRSRREEPVGRIPDKSKMNAADQTSR